MQTKTQSTTQATTPGDVRVFEVPFEAVDHTTV